MKKRLLALLMSAVMICSLIPMAKIEAEVIGGVIGSSKSITTNFKPGNCGISADPIFKASLVQEQWKSANYLGLNDSPSAIKTKFLSQYKNHFPGLQNSVIFIAKTGGISQKKSTDRVAWYEASSGTMKYYQMDAATAARKYRDFTPNTDTFAIAPTGASDLAFYGNVGTKTYISKLTGKSVTKKFQDLTVKELATGDFINFMDAAADYRCMKAWNYILSGYDVNNGITDRIKLYTGESSLPEDPAYQTAEDIRKYMLRRIDLMMTLSQLTVDAEKAWNNARIQEYAAQTAPFNLQKPVLIAIETAVRLYSNENFGSYTPIISSLNCLEYMIAATPQSALTYDDLPLSSKGPNSTKNIL